MLGLAAKMYLATMTSIKASWVRQAHPTLVKRLVLGVGAHLVAETCPLQASGVGAPGATDDPSVKESLQPTGNVRA